MKKATKKKATKKKSAKKKATKKKVAQNKHAVWLEPFNFSDKCRAELIKLFTKWAKSEDGADSFISDLEAGVERYKYSAPFNEVAPSADDHKKAIEGLRKALDTLSRVAKTTNRNTLNLVRDVFLLEYDENPYLLELIKSDDWVKQIIGLKISCDTALDEIKGKEGHPPYLSELHLAHSIAGAFERFGLGEINGSATGKGAKVLKNVLLDLKPYGVSEENAQTRAGAIMKSYIRQTGHAAVPVGDAPKT